MRNKRPTKTNLPRAAFTLIEFIVVATIIGVLAALIVPRVIDRIGASRQAVARQKISVLSVKLHEFRLDCGRFPTNQEGLRALLAAPSDVSDKWKEPYLSREKDILDPWDVEFRYQHPGHYSIDFDIWTFGADGQEGGEDEEDEDIGNWML